METCSGGIFSYQPSQSPVHHPKKIKTLSPDRDSQRSAPQLKLFVRAQLLQEFVPKRNKTTIWYIQVSALDKNAAALFFLYKDDF